LIAAAAIIERDAQVVPASLKGWRSTGPVTVPMKLSANGTSYPLHVTMVRSWYAITVHDETAELTVESSNGNVMRFRADDWEESARYAFEGDTLYLDYAGHTEIYEDITYAPPAGDAAVSDGVLKAPMAGEIVRVNVLAGATVKKGEVLVILGAMKIENQIVAPFDGVVDTVGVSAGDQVEANRVLLTLSADAT
jgi:geranyl-CoA carboxylase alpha subunit